jgi:uncharacterized protein (TIGR03089 family)
VAAVSLDPMGRDFGGEVPPGAVDYLAESRLHGDDFLALAPVPGDTPCLADSTVDEVLAVARRRAERNELTSSSRVLSTMDWTVPEGVLEGLVSVLAAGASLVQVSNSDPDLLDKHRDTERATFVMHGA